MCYYDGYIGTVETGFVSYAHNWHNVDYIIYYIVVM